MKHVLKRGNVYYYQRRVPTDLRRFYKGPEIRRSLKTSDPSHAAIHAAALDKQYDAEFLSKRINPTPATSGRSHEALAAEALAALSVELGLSFQPGTVKAGGAREVEPSGDSPEGLEEVIGKLDVLTDVVMDRYADQGPDQERLGREIIRLARQGPRYRLSDVAELYAGRVTNREQPDVKREWKRLIAHLDGEDLYVEELTREHALGFRDSLNDLRRTTIERYLGRISAGLELYRKEVDRSYDNVFREIDLRGAGQEPKERRHLTTAETKMLIKTLTQRNDQDDIDRAILLVLATGARIAEVVGLRKEDVHHATEEGTTFVSLEAHDARGLKTAGSRREVPVVSFGLRALLDQLHDAEANEGSVFLFERYNRKGKTNGGSASAALGKRIKAVGPSFKDLAAHNLRHTSKRLMRNAGVTKDISDIIHGHAGSTVADTYGRGVALERMKEALEAAFEGLEP
jgi:integrase